MLTSFKDMGGCFWILLVLVLQALQGGERSPPGTCSPAVSSSCEWRSCYIVDG